MSFIVALVLATHDFIYEFKSYLVKFNMLTLFPMIM